MKIALAQMRVIPGDPVKNFSTIKENVAKATDEGCHVIAFPEMSIGGYVLSDRWTEQSWCEYLMEFNEQVKEISKNIAIIYGNIYLDKTNINKDGRPRKYNAAYVYYNQSIVKRFGSLPESITIKSLLPNYRIFDDERYFFSLQEFAWEMGCEPSDLLHPFELTIEGKSVKIGVEVCEDLWFTDYKYKNEPLNVTNILTNNGADCIINISSSPWTYGKNWARNNRIKDILSHSKTFIPFYYVNCVGMQNNGKNIITFDGDSTVYNSKGEIVATVNVPYSEELLICQNPDSLQPKVKSERSKIEHKYQAILEGIRGMDLLMGSDRFKYIVGLSGGVDSALVCTLLERAIGRDRIIACNLPGKYNSQTTKSIANHVSNKLKIEFHEIPIEPLFETNYKTLCQFNPSEFNCENIQAKIRGTSILSNLAGIYNGVMTCNGNKVEIALGYATLYGDVNGAIAPIGDLLKTEIFEMTEYINEKIFHDEVIPNELIPDKEFNFKMPPSAELKHNQIDPMKWGYHDRLIEMFTDYKKVSADTILEWYYDGSLCENMMLSSFLFTKYNLSDPEIFISDLEWVMNSIQRAVFKRIQSPPIIILSKSAYGYDIRESQLPVYFSNKYKRLREKILTKTNS